MDSEGHWLMNHPGKYNLIGHSCVDIVNQILSAGAVGVSTFASFSPNLEGLYLEEMAVGSHGSYRWGGTIGSYNPNQFWVYNPFSGKLSH